jgi:hypothetical protein
MGVREGKPVAELSGCEGRKAKRNSHARRRRPDGVRKGLQWGVKKRWAGEAKG